MTRPFATLRDEAYVTRPARQWLCTSSRLAKARRLPVSFGTKQARLAIANDCETVGAGLEFTLPGCDAVILHLPGAVRWTRATLTVHWPLAANETRRPESAAARTVKSGSLKTRSG